MLLAIIGFVISIAGILIPIYISSRKYKISYTEHIDKLYLFQNEGDVIASVSYKGENCKCPFVIANLAFKNEGNKDIVFNHKFDRPVVINSQVIKIIDIKCTQKKEEINSKVELKDNSIFLSWGILKKGESIFIDVFGNVINTEIITQLEGHCFNVSHRAADINKLTQKSHIMNKYKKLILISSVFLIIPFYATFINGMREEPLVGNVSYKGELIDNATILYNVFSDKYYITTIEKRVERYIPSEDISDITVSKYKLPSNHYRLIHLISVIVLSIAWICMYVYLYMKMRKYPDYMIKRYI